MPPKAAFDPDLESHLPAPLAAQVEILRAKLAPQFAQGGAELLRELDAALLAICEIAQVTFDVMNCVLAIRTSAEQYSQRLDARDPAREEMRERALDEVAALEAVLKDASPSAAAQRAGVDW